MLIFVPGTIRATGLRPAFVNKLEERAITVAPPPTVLANAIDLEISAAVDGLGIIRTFEECLMPEIKAGRLVPVLEDWVTSFPGPYLYYAGRRHMPAPLRAFVDFLKARQRQSLR